MDSDFECPICYNPKDMYNVVKLHDDHYICLTCEKSWKDACQIAKKDFTCPLCQKVLQSVHIESANVPTSIFSTITDDDIDLLETAMLDLANFVVRGVGSILHSRNTNHSV